MHKKFEVNRTKIKGGCQSETKAAQQHSCIDLTLVYAYESFVVLLVCIHNSMYITVGCHFFRLT